MAADGVDALLLSVGPDLPWLIGYEAMPLERLTMLVVRADGPATLVIPRFEVPRVVERPDVFSIVGWGETEDPVAIVADLARGAGTAAIGDHTWEPLPGRPPGSPCQPRPGSRAARSPDPCGPPRNRARSSGCRPPPPVSTGSPPPSSPVRSP